MKTTDTQKIQLGIFVIVGTLLFVTAVYLIGQRQNLFETTATVNTYFRNINGLQKGNNVRYSGIDIGTVKAISMINDSTIQVAMAIEQTIMTHIKTDAIATIGSDGLVGNMIINIVPGKGASKTAIKDGDTLNSYSKIGTDDILSTLSVSSENAAILTADLLKITNAIIKGKGTLGLLLNDTLMAQDLSQSVSHLNSATYRITETINDFNDLISDIKSNDNTVLDWLVNDTLSGQKLKTMVRHLESSGAELRLLLAQASEVVLDFKNSSGPVQYALTDSAAVESLKASLKNINDGTEKFNQNMEALKHNFLTRGYFRKLERQQRKEEAKAND